MDKEEYAQLKEMMRKTSTKDPRLANLKIAILELKDFQDGFSVNEYQIREALKKEKRVNPTKDDLLLALGELIRELKIFGIPIYDDRAGHEHLVVQSFARISTVLSEDIVEIPIEEIANKNKES